MSDRFIVAEVSKNWPETGLTDGKTVAQLFEGVINTNWGRGYRLNQFQLHTVVAGPGLINETIVAVFERREGRPGKSG